MGCKNTQTMEIIFFIRLCLRDTNAMKLVTLYNKVHKQNPSCY